MTPHERRVALLVRLAEEREELRRLIGQVGASLVRAGQVESTAGELTKRFAIWWIPAAALLLLRGRGATGITVKAMRWYPLFRAFRWLMWKSTKQKSRPRLWERLLRASVNTGERPNGRNGPTV